MAFNFTAIFFYPLSYKTEPLPRHIKCESGCLGAFQVWANPTFQVSLYSYLHLSFPPVLLSGPDNSSLLQVCGEFAGGGKRREEGFGTSIAPPALLSLNRGPAMRKE